MQHPLYQFLEQYALELDNNRTTYRYQSLLDRACISDWHPSPIEQPTKLTFAYNDLRPPHESEHHRPVPRLGIPNGWPTEQTALQEFINQNWQHNNQGMIGNVADIAELEYSISINREVSQPLFVSFWDLHNIPSSNKRAEIRGLADLPQAPYIYPITLPGSNYFDLPIVQSKGIHLPQRVVKDVQEGRAKILLNQVFEGHGLNECRVRQLFETTASTHNIPMSAFGFIDSNFFTPTLQEEYGTRGFFYPFWEHHTAKPDSWHAQASSIVEHMYKQSRGDTNYSSLFLNLNRRPRIHRTIITAAIEQWFQHNTFWSYTDVNKEAILLPFTHDHFVTEQYLKELPRIMDVAGSVNDTHLNTEMQYKAHINVASETMCFEPSTLFFSEKIFKPLLAGQPFILVGPAHSLRLLRQMGYNSFDPYIDESYDDEINPARRLRMIIDEMHRLSSLSHCEIQELVYSMNAICVHNHQHMIARELNATALNSTLSEIYSWLHGNA
jgi:hypothetical protein